MSVYNGRNPVKTNCLQEGIEPHADPSRGTALAHLRLLARSDASLYSLITGLDERLVRCEQALERNGYNVCDEF